MENETMMTMQDAKRTLDIYEARAANEDDQRYGKRFGQSWFSVEIGDIGLVQYQWGVNVVDKDVALAIVRSFAQPIK
jgi:hypothetical protein